jgi:hypothetical protein
VRWSRRASDGTSDGVQKDVVVVATHLPQGETSYACLRDEFALCGCRKKFKFKSSRIKSETRTEGFCVIVGYDDLRIGVVDIRLRNATMRQGKTF